MVFEWLQKLSEVFPDKQQGVSGTVVQDGVAIERRLFLSGPATLAASFLLEGSIPQSAGSLSFEEFTKRAMAYGTKVTAGPAGAADEDEYVLTIASLAVH